MDDIAEQHDIANEISNAISNPVGFGEDIDEDELNKELELLEEEELEKVIFLKLLLRLLGETLMNFRDLSMYPVLPNYPIFRMWRKRRKKKSKNQPVRQFNFHN